jgi:cytochrome c-type biogenesis protein
MPALASSGLANTVYSGPLIVAAAVAMLDGLIGVLSPCVLPLVPGYLSYVAGLAGSGEEPRPRRMLGGAALFVLGFTAVFVALGALFGRLGSAIADHLLLLERIFGSITIVLGLGFLGFIPALQREYRIHRLPQAGLIGAPLLGVTFGLAWGPCLTPTLSAVISLATNQATAGRGALLMVFYCIGLGVPFLLVAAGFGWVTGALGLLRRHRRLVSQIGGILLIAIGVLLVTGSWDHWMNELRARFPNAVVGSSL